jgi:GTP-binding protein Era
VDASTPPGDEDRKIASLLSQQSRVPIVLVLNKTDLLVPEEAVTHLEAYQALGSFEDWLPISALHGSNLERLLEMMIEELPFGPRFYPEEQITDQQLRFMAAELVREQALRHLRHEIPYSVAVIVEQFKERSDDLTYINATIFVERDTQKAIVLGQGGRMIKQIGRDARREIEDLLGNRVYLELWVKVRKKWRRDEKKLRQLGYSVPGRQ